MVEVLPPVRPRSRWSIGQVEAGNRVTPSAEFIRWLEEIQRLLESAAAGTTSGFTPTALAVATYPVAGPTSLPVAAYGSGGGGGGVSGAQYQVDVLAFPEPAYT